MIANAKLTGARSVIGLADVISFKTKKMNLTAIKNKTKTLTEGKTYKARKVNQVKNKVLVIGDYGKENWYSLNNFKVDLKGKKLPRFIVSVEGSIYINAAYRRKVFSEWVYLMMGNQKQADELTRHCVRKDVKRLIQIVGRQNMDDLVYWMKKLKRHGLTKENATFADVWGVVEKIESWK